MLAEALASIQITKSEGRKCRVRQLRTPQHLANRQRTTHVQLDTACMKRMIGAE